jgi:acetyltransferase EpsM
MSNLPITLIGCGAQAKYAIEIFARTGRLVSRVLDPLGYRVGEQLGDVSIEPFNLSLLIQNKRCTKINSSVLICLSDNKIKRDIFRKIDNKINIINAIHPKSSIASTSELKKGLIINAGAVIQPYAKIGNGCMIHAGVVVEHDSVINDFANLAPGVTLAGGVVVGEGVTVNSGAIVVPNVEIGKYAIIGAGSLVLHDIPAGVLAYGSPAKIVKRLDE